MQGFRSAFCWSGWYFLLVSAAASWALQRWVGTEDFKARAERGGSTTLDAPEVTLTRGTLVIAAVQYVQTAIELIAF